MTIDEIMDSLPEEKGEVIESSGNFISMETANDLFLKYYMLLEQLEMFKTELKKAMISNDMKSWDTGDYEVKVVENKPSKRLDEKAVRKTIEEVLGESIENYYRMTEVKSPYKLVITDKSKKERSGR